MIAQDRRKKTMAISISIRTVSLCFVLLARSYFCLGLLSSSSRNPEISRIPIQLYSSLADGGYIDSETLKSSDEQQEIRMPNFDGKVVQWFKKAGDRVYAGDAILAVESVEKADDGFRINTDIEASKDGYLAARYNVVGDLVDARDPLATLVRDQASLATFLPAASASSSKQKSWWATSYEPGRPDPFEAESPLGNDDNDDDEVTARSFSSPAAASTGTSSNNAAANSFSTTSKQPTRPDPFQTPAASKNNEMSGSSSFQNSVSPFPQSDRSGSSPAGSSRSTAPAPRPSRPDPFQPAPRISERMSNSSSNNNNNAFQQQQQQQKSSNRGSFASPPNSFMRGSSSSSSGQSSRRPSMTEATPFYQRQEPIAISPGSASMKQSIFGGTGSMNLNSAVESSSLPSRSNLNYDGNNNMRQQQQSAFGYHNDNGSPYFFQIDDNNYNSGEQSPQSPDYVEFLEARGMRDDVPQYYRGPTMQRVQPTLVTRSPSRTTPTPYDVAASTVGGSLIGISVGVAGTLYPELGLDMSNMLALADLGPTMMNVVPPVLWGMVFATVGYAGGNADNDAGYAIRHIFGLGNSVKYGLRNLVTSTRHAVEETANTALRLVSGKKDPPLRVHHITIKTRDIISAMEFYSLLGFESNTQFRVDQGARAAWLDNVVIGAGRIELIEVPANMLQETAGGRRRALDRVRNQELLGLNHWTLDVTDVVRKKRLLSLSEFLGLLNDESYELYGKGLRLAVEPKKQAIGDYIYESAFLYDPDGSLIQLQHRTNERVQEFWSNYYLESNNPGEEQRGAGPVDQLTPTASNDYESYRL